MKYLPLLLAILLSACTPSPEDDTLGRYMLHHQGWQHGSQSYPPTTAPPGSLSSSAIHSP